MRRIEIDRKRALRDAMVKGKKPAKKAKAKKKVDADVNKDGKIDEKDMELVREAAEADKKKKKIVKK